LSRSDSVLFDLYDETADDDYFAPDIGSTLVDRRSAEPGSTSTSRASSTTRSGQLQAADASSTDRPAVTGGSVVEPVSGRLPRPHSAILTRESAMTMSPLLQVQSADDDSVTTLPGNLNLLTVPSSWYRTEVATNVGAGSSRLTANVQLHGLTPPPATASTAELSSPHYTS